MRFISWNVNGLRAAIGKGFVETFTDFDADCGLTDSWRFQHPGLEGTSQGTLVGR